MWVVVIGIILLILVFHSQAISDFTELISSGSLIPSSIPGSQSQNVNVVNSQASEKVMPNSLSDYLNNPVLQMMGKTVIAQGLNIATTGSIQAPASPGAVAVTIPSVMIGMGGADLNTGGKIAQDITSAVSAMGYMAGVELGGGVAIGAEGGLVGVAQVGAVSFGGAVAALAFPALVLGEIIGGFFEGDSSPLTSAQMKPIRDAYIAGGIRIQKLHSEGFTDIQIMDWVSKNSGWWFILGPKPREAWGPNPTLALEDSNFNPYTITMLSSEIEKEILDNYALNVMSSSDFATLEGNSYALKIMYSTDKPNWASLVQNLSENEVQTGWINFPVDIKRWGFDQLNWQNNLGVG
jgi:hypothetical protein